VLREYTTLVAREPHRQLSPAVPACGILCFLTAFVILLHNEDRGTHRWPEFPKDGLPTYLECHPINRAYYYKNPSMAAKANLGKDRTVAIRLAKSLNARYRLEIEQRAARIEAVLDFGSVPFRTAFDDFVSKYIDDYRLKSSTARRLRQRQQRLTDQLGEIQVPAITTHVLRETIATDNRGDQR
jgi:hypothetical protein